MSAAGDVLPLARTGLRQAAIREWRYICRSRWDQLVLFGLPWLTLVLMAVMFHASYLQQMPVVLVDHDQSALSRQLIQGLLADRRLSLSVVTEDDALAMQRLRTAKAMAVAVLPAGLERALIRGEPSTVPVGYSAAFQTAGSQAAGALSGDLGEVMRHFMIEHAPWGGVTRLHLATPRIQVSQVGNGQTSFERFLEPLVLAGVLHLLLSCAAVAAVGRELKQGTFYRWGAPEYGLMLRRLCGKLLPPTLIYMGWFALIPYWLHLIRGWPISGHLWVWLLGQWALCAATSGIAALLVTATREIDTAFSASTFYAGSALTYSNGTLPILHASWFTRTWSQMLPFTHYLKIQNQQFTMGSDPSASMGPLAVLVGIALGTVLLASWLWQRALRQPPAAGEAPRLCGPSPDETRCGASFIATLISIGRDRSMFSMCVLSVLLYGFYYPQAYRSEVTVKLPVAVVDQDHTHLSQQLVRAIGDTRAVAVTMLTTDLPAAQRAMRNGVVDGMVVIAPHLQAALLSPRAGGIAIYVPAAWLVRARDIGAAVRSAISGLAKEKASPFITVLHQAEPPGQVLSVPMFNITDGYGGYVVPAVAAIILHQTLLFGTALLVALRREQARRWQMQPGALLGCWLALTLIGCLTSGFYFGFVFWFQDFPRMGNPLALLLTVPLFAGTVVAFGLAVGSYFERADRTLQVMSGLSVLLFFLGGVSWPLFAMPHALALLARLLPSTTAMQLFVQLNSNAASLYEVRGLLATLCLQWLVVMAWAAWRLLPRRSQARAPAPSIVMIGS